MNKNIELTAFGNALVDLQFKVDDALFDTLNTKRGIMELTDAGVQKDLLAKLSECNFNRCSGGSAANSVIAFSKFGGTAAYKSVIGNDEMGAFYENEFKELGIELVAPKLDTDPTGTCVVVITPDAERTMFTCLGASGKFKKEYLNEEIIARSQWLYLEGYELFSPNGSEATLEAAMMAKDNNTKIAFTFSDLSVINFCGDKLDKIAGMSDLIFCNESEAMEFSKKDNFDAAYKYIANEFPNAAVTMGAKGSVVKWDGKDYEIPSFPVKPVDTTGAGDMFAGAFFYGIIKSGDAIKAGKLASMASSRVVAQLGARLAEDHKELAKQVL